MVRENEVTKKVKGGQANPLIVVPSKNVAVLRRIGLECVDHFLEEQKAAYCQVWGSEIDYKNRDPEGVGDRICWIFFMGVPLNGGEPQIQDTPAYLYELDKCKGGVLKS